MMVGRCTLLPLLPLLPLFTLSLLPPLVASALKKPAAISRAIGTGGETEKGGRGRLWFQQRRELRRDVARLKPLVSKPDPCVPLTPQNRREQVLGPGVRNVLVDSEVLGRVQEHGGPRGERGGHSEGWGVGEWGVRSKGNVESAEISLSIVSASSMITS